MSRSRQTTGTGREIWARCPHPFPMRRCPRSPARRSAIVMVTSSPRLRLVLKIPDSNGGIVGSGRCEAGVFRGAHSASPGDQTLPLAMGWSPSERSLGGDGGLGGAPQRAEDDTGADHLTLPRLVLQPVHLAFSPENGDCAGTFGVRERVRLARGRGEQSSSMQNSPYGPCLGCTNTASRRHYISGDLIREPRAWWWKPDDR